MDYSLAEDQIMLRETIREFAQNEIAPVILEYDEKQEFPLELCSKMAEMGLLGIIFPAEYGGSGLTYIDYVNILIELARVDGSTALTVAAHNSLCSNHIYLAGSEEQKKKYLVPLASGRKIGAWGLTEPGSGSDAGDLKTTAVRDGDHWVLNGTKNFITNATVGEISVVIARTDPSKGHRGTSSFILEKGTPGFSPGKKENKLGCRSSDTAQLILEDCRIPNDNMLGKEGEGFKDSLRVLDGGRISIAAMAVGIAQGSLDESIKYSKERVQFNKPISQNQAIQWMLADMATRIEAAKQLTYRAAYLKDLGKTVTLESSMAKLFASEAAVRCSEQAIQIHGGYGFTKDYPVERFYRDCKLCTIGEGTSEIQRFVIARQMIGDDRS